MLIELAVGLKVPDNVEITALRTLRALSINVASLKRWEYYSFEIDDNMEEQLRETLLSVDVIVNANKNYALWIDNEQADMDKNHPRYMGRLPSFLVLVEEQDPADEHLLRIISERLLIGGVKHVERGTLWRISTPEKEGEGIVRQALEQLLFNRHYQKYKILGKIRGGGE